MLTALKKIRALPGHTKIWCAHEYSLMYLKNAARVEPWNEATKARIKVMEKILDQKQPTVPLLLSEEILTNIYLHWDHPNWVEPSSNKTDLEIFQKIAESDG
jgi:hydroxyacylglutathione hydrolase